MEYSLPGAIAHLLEWCGVPSPTFVGLDWSESSAAVVGIRSGTTRGRRGKKGFDVTFDGPSCTPS